MAELDPTCIGRVRHVLGATVTVALIADWSVMDQMAATRSRRR